MEAAAHGGFAPSPLAPDPGTCCPCVPDKGNQLSSFWIIILNAIISIFITFLSKYWDPISAHIGFPFGLDDRFTQLLDAVGRVKEIKGDLIRMDPYPHSERGRRWFDREYLLHCNTEIIRQTLTRCRSWHYFTKCSAGKDTDKELKRAVQLYNDGKDLLQEARGKSCSGYIVLRQYPPHHQLYGVGSYKEKILEYISSNVTQPLLGIWGMAGVGKTALLQLVHDSQHEFVASFDYTIFLQAGKGCSVDKLRQAISVAMGLPVENGMECRIHNHLMDRQFLLLIDDLWDPLVLSQLGIPMPLGSVEIISVDGVARHLLRKVVFTTRSLNLCGKMYCANNVIQLGFLSEENSWKLFMRSLQREIANDEPIHQFAKKIVAECSGLPMALCIIGRAMSTKRDLHEWECALDFLKESKLTDMDETWFPCLKLSYDSLTENQKGCFLLCSLWPEDENIPRQNLIEWWIGMGLLNVDNPITMGINIINLLLSESLLQKGDYGMYTSVNTHVKIHRMMRRMALRVVNDCGEGDIWLPHSICRPYIPADKWSMVRRAWLLSADSNRWRWLPKLTMFVTRDSFSLEAFGSFKDITFLDLMGTRRDLFPKEICEMVKLQFLNLSATTIKALPAELAMLSKLRYLYLRDTSDLQVIPEKLISKFKELQVLDLFCSGGTSSEIHYFDSLMKDLTSETITISLGINVQSQSDISLLDQSYNIRTSALCLNHFQDQSHMDIIDLRVISKLNTVKELSIVKSSFCKELVANGNLTQDGRGLLPQIEFLELSCLQNLQKVTWSNAGRGIRSLVIHNCCKVKNVTWVQYLCSLRELTLAYCPEMEEIIKSAEIVPSQMTKIFSHLERLYLEQLPELSSISKQTFSFNELSYVFVSRCDNLKVIRIAERINKMKIKIDCKESWWSGLRDQHIMDRHFLRNFCF